MIYIGHAVNTHEVLTVAINCIALVWCGSVLNHFAQEIGHTHVESVFHTCVEHTLTIYVIWKTVGGGLPCRGSQKQAILNQSTAAVEYTAAHYIGKECCSPNSVLQVWISFKNYSSM